MSDYGSYICKWFETRRIYHRSEGNFQYFIVCRSLVFVGILLICFLESLVGYLDLKHTSKISWYQILAQCKPILMPAIWINPKVILNPFLSVYSDHGTMIANYRNELYRVTSWFDQIIYKAIIVRAARNYFSTIQSHSHRSVLKLGLLGRIFNFHWICMIGGGWTKSTWSDIFTSPWTI